VRRLPRQRPPGQVRRWRWPAASLEDVRGSGTHDLSLGEVLRLARHLGRLPPEILIWTIETGARSAGDQLTVAVASAVNRVVETLRDEWARTGGPWAGTNG
jgi:hydrogenase maturation protease